jgi:dihydropteroate synthase
MPSSLNLRAGAYARVLDRPLIMGVLNVTPDSFSDGGRFDNLEDALAHAREMVAAGADIIDVGGESTRPGSPGVPVEVELQRVIPVLNALRAAVDVPLSIDTSKPEVMREAVAAGASMINDVNALRAPGALEAAVESEAAVCLMHMRGVPRSMQERPVYRDVVAEVEEFLRARVRELLGRGVAPERIVLDPGFGFGKTLEHNRALFRALPRFAALGHPLLVGVSRKSMIGSLLGDRPMDGRVTGSVAAALLAAQAGAHIVRVHDVRETADALAMHAALGLPGASEG